MHKRYFSVFRSSTVTHVVVVALVASFFSFSSALDSYACASDRITISGCTDSISRTYSASEVHLYIPHVAVSGVEIMTINSFDSSDLMKINLSIAGWVFGINHFNAGAPISITMPKSSIPNSILAFSEDEGTSWIPIPVVSSPSDITDYVTGTGYKDNGDGTVTIYTYHLSIFGFEVPAAPVPVPDPQQQSSLTSVSPTKAIARGQTPIVITGTFVEKVTNITFNGVAITRDSWIQTPTTLSISMSNKAIGQYAIQVYNGSIPLLPEQTFTSLAPAVIPTVQVVRAKIIYIRCILGNHLRVVRGLSPHCP